MPSLFFVVLVFILTTIFWNQTLLLPLKLLVVLVHEFGHGVLALLFSAELKNIQINIFEEGDTIVRQLNSTVGFIITASAGYLGTSLLGAIFLNRSIQRKNQRAILTLFAFFLGYMTLLFCQFGNIAFYVGLGFAVFFSFFCIFCREILLHWLLIILGAFFMWYSFYDLLDFTHGGPTDATILANYLISLGWVEQISKESMARFIAFFWTILIFFTFLVAIVSATDLNLHHEDRQDLKELELPESAVQVDETQDPPRELMANNDSSNHSK